MKKLFFLCVTLVAVVAASAQNPIATLNSGDSIKTFYGIDAFKSAYESAVHGDVITLSEGVFKSTTIRKKITIRGAGMGDFIDINKENNMTILKGTFSIAQTQDTVGGTGLVGFMMEGVRCVDEVDIYDLRGAQFLKCAFNILDLNANDGLPAGGKFINCYVYGYFSPLYNSDFVAINSVFWGKDTYFDGNTSQFNLQNCIVECNNSNDFNKAILTNCIIIDTSDSEYTTIKHSLVYNSIWFGGKAKDPLLYAYDQNNHIFPQDSALFVEGTFYELTEAAKQFRGTDGKEVGIYGGDLPFAPTPSVPQITKFEVAPKTTADGKLSVDIEISQP